ncbi:MAG: VWA domain-containing protein [Planctomycetaceae bacterium]
MSDVRHNEGFRQRGLLNAVASSLTLHLTFAVMLAVAHVHQLSSSAPLEIQTGIAEELALPSVVEQELLVAATPNQQSAASSLNSPTDIVIGSSSPQDVQLSEVSDPIALFSEQLPSSQLTEVVGAAPSFDGISDGAGDGEGGRSFFGLKPEGDRTVFVVDASFSMNHPHPPPAKTRFKRVKLELLKAVECMEPQQQFFIVFFNEAAIPMPSRQLVSADPNVSTPFMRWMATVPAQGKTDPTQALLIALSLQPDNVVLLTDGDIPVKTSRLVRQANVKGTPIHTIGFGDDTGEKRLQEIAEQNGGTYRFIPETPTVAVTR